MSLHLSRRFVAFLPIGSVSARKIFERFFLRHRRTGIGSRRGAVAIMPRRFAFAALRCLAAGLLMASAAAAQDLGQIEPGQQIVLPLDMSGVSGEIWIEVDSVDVTEFATLSDDQLVLAPALPFEGNEHRIVVYLWLPDGYEVFAEFRFSSPGGAAGWTLSGDAVHEAGIRAVNGDTDGFATSSGEVSASNTAGTVEARASYLATSRGADQINGNPLDLGDYFVQVRQPGALLDFSARLGTQTLDYDRALIGDVSRRGVGFSIGRPDQRLELGFFALRSDDRPGSDNVLGVGDGDDRFHGGRVALRPLANFDLRLSLQAYDGRATPDGGLVTGAGDGLSFAVDGTGLGGRLRYDAALGRTDWDEDAGGGLFASVEADAMLASVAYDVPGLDEAGRSLSLGLGYERVDQFYFSLANPGLPTGAETVRATADYTAERLALFLQADTQKTAIGGLPTWQTDRISQASLDGTWNLQSTGWLADGRLRFGGGGITQSRLDTPNQAPPPENFTTLNGYLGIEVFRQDASWSVQYALLDTDDRSGQALDSQSHTLDAWLDMAATERLKLTARGNFVYADETPGDWSRGELALGSRYELVPERWALGADAGLTTTDQPGLTDGYFAAADLSWRFSKAADLVLSAAYRRGSYAGESGNNSDAIFGLLIRASTQVLR